MKKMYLYQPCKKKNANVVEAFPQFSANCRSLKNNIFVLKNVLDFYCFACTQYLCKKNIKLYIETCRLLFNMKDPDLFQPQDLFEMEDFAKVKIAKKKQFPVPPVYIWSMLF